MRLVEMNLRELLQTIRNRPNMYLGGLGTQVAIDRFDAYLRGFCDGRATLNDNLALRDLSNFQAWYQQTHGPEKTPLSVTMLLLDKHNGDDAKAFCEFFE